MSRAEWHQAPDFAEVAEAVRLPTDHIMAVMREGAVYVVLYTPMVEGDEPPVYRAALRRDRDGILRPADVPRRLPDFYKRMRAMIEQRLDEQLPGNDGGGS